MNNATHRVLVLGATGYVGRHLVDALHREGYTVRAVVRDRARAEAPGAYDAPGLGPLVDEWVVSADAAREHGADLMDGVDHVVSALGVTRQPADPWDVDFLMNLRYLRLAEAAAVSSFLYVGVMNAATGTSGVARAKYAFMEALVRSRVTPQIVNPSGYFSDLTEIFDLARRGWAFGLGEGGVRLAPIHGADLAQVCLDRLADGAAGTWDVGGPDVLTYRDVVDLAFAAAGRRPRYVRLPAGLAPRVVWAADRLGPRAGSLTRFFLEGMQVDSVGTPHGSRTLRDYFAARANAAGAPGAERD